MIHRVNIHALAGYISRLPKERHEAGVRAARRTMRERGRMLVVLANRATKPRPAFDRGDYERSWKVIDIPRGVRIYSISAYAAIIERGRRPGTFPPIQPLVDWVHRHGLATDTSVLASAARRQRSQKNFMDFLGGMKKSRRQTIKDERPRAELSIAFAIAAAIKKRGMAAKHVFGRAAIEIVKVCRQAVHGAFAGAEEA